MDRPHSLADPGRGQPHRPGGAGLPLDAVRDCFARLAAGPAPLAVDGWDFPALPDRPVPIDELRDRLLARRCPRRTRDAVWAHLVHRARTGEPAWTLACAGMALPALASAARWLGARYPGQAADVHAEVLAGFLAALPALDTDTPNVAARLRWAAFPAGDVALAEAVGAPTPTRAGLRPAAPRPPGGHPDLVLARAVGHGVLTRTEADVIGATRLGADRLTDWARATGADPKSAYRLRARAERRLRAYLTETARDLDPDDPVATHVLARTPPASPPRPRAAPGPRPGRPARRAPHPPPAGPQPGAHPGPAQHEPTPTALPVPS